MPYLAFLWFCCHTGVVQADEEWTDRVLVALGREIKAMRVKRGLSRAQLAEAAKISERQLGKIERGERGQFSEVWNVAQALNVSLSWLIAEAEASQADDAGDGGATVIHTPDGSTYLMPPGARVSWAFADHPDGGGFDPNPMRRNYELAAHDEEHDIEDEQGHDEFP